jgi:hypothetical protein
MGTRSEELLALVRALEVAQPFTVASVERALGTKLVAARGPHEPAALVSSGVPTTAFGLVLARVELRPGREATGTRLYLEVSRSEVRQEHADPTLPGGGWSPPPPPGWGPPDAGPVYWVDRPWGLLGLAFRADGTLARVSCSVGNHVLPGI